MAADSSSNFLQVIQTAITPVIMLSGVGALMITLTNRLGRIVDRTRILAGDLRKGLPQQRAHIDSQLAIMWRRAKLMRLAVTYAAVSMLFSCLLVVAVFIDASEQREFGLGLVIIFMISVFSLIAALVAFLRDIWVSLHALDLEVTDARKGP